MTSVAKVDYRGAAAPKKTNRQTDKSTIKGASHYYIREQEIERETYIDQEEDRSTVPESISDFVYFCLGGVEYTIPHQYTCTAASV